MPSSSPLWRDGVDKGSLRYRGDKKRRVDAGGSDMQTIDEIKDAIETLPDAEKSALKRWLDEIDAEIFDAKIERDAASGRLDGLVAKARANYRAGRRTPL